MKCSIISIKTKAANGFISLLILLQNETNAKLKNTTKVQLDWSAIITRDDYIVKCGRYWNTSVLLQNATVIS